MKDELRKNLGVGFCFRYCNYTIQNTFAEPLRNFFTASIISFFSFCLLLDTSCWTWDTSSRCNCSCSDTSTQLLLPLQLFYDLLSGTIQVSHTRRTNHFGFCWSRHDGVAVASAEPYASYLHFTPEDNHASKSSVRFLRAGCPSWHPTNSVKALKAIKALKNLIK